MNPRPHESPLPKLIPVVGWILFAGEVLEVIDCLLVECSDEAIRDKLHPYDPMTPEELEKLKKCVEDILKEWEDTKKRYEGEIKPILEKWKREAEQWRLMKERWEKEWEMQRKEEAERRRLLYATD
jgi:hypothetical protein